VCVCVWRRVGVGVWGGIFYTDYNDVRITTVYHCSKKKVGKDRFNFLMSFWNLFKSFDYALNFQSFLAHRKLRSS